MWKGLAAVGGDQGSVEGGEVKGSGRMQMGGRPGERGALEGKGKWSNVEEGKGGVGEDT